METHKRVLAIIYIISGVFQILAMIIVASLMSAILPFITEQADADAQWVFTWIVPFIRVIGVTVVLLFSIPSIIAGWGLLNQKKWALTLALILGCFKLFSFPIGTAIGVYAIWIYAQENRTVAQV